MLSQILVPHGETKAVYNRLFIGDYYTLRHHQHHHQFTHVLSCMPLEQRQETWAYTEVDGARAKNRSRKTRKLIFRRWKIVNVLDTPREQFELHFHECADFIHKCLSDTSASGDNDGKVYVHWYAAEKWMCTVYVCTMWACATNTVRNSNCHTALPECLDQSLQC